MSFGPAFIPAAQRTARSDGENTRARLLQAALQLFSEKGFSQTSVRAIAEAAGTNVAAIAYHFGDKAQLYTATFYEPFGSGSDLIPAFSDPALDLPQALQNRGGWPNRDIAGWYADYAALVTQRYGNRVKHFATFNEPSVFTLFSYGFAWHPPGMTDPAALRTAIHCVSLAHGAGLAAQRLPL